jgi:hypothetical protein
VPEVFRINEVIIVRVYREQHLPEPPHCHVVWPDGMARLTLPDLSPMPHSERLPRGVLGEIERRLDDVMAKWNETNPLKVVSP